MTRPHLKLVDSVFTPNDRFGVGVQRDGVAEMERLVEVAWLPARQALREMEDAIARRDVGATVAACRRLSAAGELARLSAIRLEGSQE